MNKDELNKEVQDNLTTIKDHADSLNKFLEDIQGTLRPTGDASLVTLERSKEALASFTEAKLSLEKIRKALKARATQRLKDA